MHNIIKKIYLIDIKTLLLFSILLSLINLSLILKLYFFDDYSTTLINLTPSLESNLADYINVDKIDKPNKEIINTSTQETNINDLTESSKDKINNLPWTWIGLFIFLSLGFYFYCNYFSNGTENLDISSKETIKQIISSASNLGAISQGSGSEMVNLSSEQIFDSVINQGKNIRNEPSFNLIKSLIESKNIYLSQFQEGSQEYLIEKIKYTHIKSAIFKAHLEGYDMSSVANEAFSNRVNELLNNNNQLQSFLNYHGINGKDIY